MADSNSAVPPMVDEILSAAVSRHVEEQRDLRERLGSVGSVLEGFRADLSSATADVQALANAILELNAGLRDRFGALDDGVRALDEGLRTLDDGLRSIDGTVATLDARIGSFAGSVADGLQELARTQQEALEGLGAAVSSAIDRLGEDLGSAVAPRLRPLETSIRSLDQRLGTVDALRDRIGQVQTALAASVSDVRDRVGETADVVTYLRDQSEDLDRVLAAIGDVPTRVEAVLSQALRRALTVRAGLLEEAERALQEAMTPVTEQVERAIEQLEAAGEGAGRKAKGASSEDLRRVSLGQTELASRLDQLQETLASYLEATEEERRERDWALAAALDRSSELEPEDDYTAEQPAVPARGRAARAAAPKATRKAKRTVAPKAARIASPKAARTGASKVRTAERTSRAAEPSKRKGTTRAARSGASRTKATKRSSGTSSSASAEPRRTPQPSRRKRTYIPL